MYVTRPLSLYRKSPSALSAEPPEGPYTGVLVVSDELAEAQETCCWGLRKTRRIKKLPFPQDKVLTVFHSLEREETLVKKVWFIPVLDRPLSYNCYYVIKAKGKQKGLACTCSRETDMRLCCMKSVIKDVKPRAFDLRNINHQFKIHRYFRSSFFAKSVAPDGFAPNFLRRKGWEVRSSKLHNPQLSDALGLDSSLRTYLPSFDFPIPSKTSSSVVVGTWYCPFVFIREETSLKEQMKGSMLYKMTLEQHWEEIYSYESVNSEGNTVVLNVNVNVQREVDLVCGIEALKEDRTNHCGFIWYNVRNITNGRRRCSVGLSFCIVEKMKLVQEEGGWVDGEERTARVEKVVEIRSENGWRRFACYMLVESFVLRRMDGCLVLKCDFRHTHRIKCKCE
ncbi:hypothetical protein K2173_025830 [Erythroxylum novogranatense]|uniref:Uncharacterized protein n=1 Tax=Erythroxylum novogranatense TaxID=1862640 RepID=A0AAV8SI40_9ROSI|nr:hypothetical protein K2173_025830 [Erythroxylum novogranatense]